MFSSVLFTSFGLVALSMASLVAVATTYNFPTAGGDTLAVAPQALASGDTLNIDSGTFQTPSSSSVAYTASTSAATTNATTVTITVDAGATISYNGTNTAGAAISSIRSDTGSSTNTITLNGSASNGAGLYAIYLTNSNVAPNDIYNITSTGAITGAVLTSGVKTVTLNLSGASSSVTGTITLAVNSAGTSTLNIVNGANFTPTQAVADISQLNIDGTSSLTLNTLTSDIKALTVASGGTANINSPLVGVTVSDGNIINNGTLNIASNINKTGTFTGTGTNNVSEAVTVTTSSYNLTGGTHNTILGDVSSYGSMTLSTAAFTATDVTVTGGSGYFPAGTYTLVTSPVSVTVTNQPIPAPTSTLFLSFNTPVINPNNIQITISRTPFNTFATSTMTQAIGVNLESIGSGSPSSSMITLLNAIEASTNANQVEYSLQQLAPLTTAPIFGLEVQNNTMRQVQLRLAELRDRETYFAGDIAKDNYLWVRPFGGYANQKAKDDSFGYYGSGGGFAAGFDRNLGANYNVGAAGAYALSHVKDKVKMESRTEIKSYIGMVYGSYNFPDTHYFDWIVAVVANNFDASRVVNINGYYQVATSSYGSQQVSFKGLWGREFAAFGFMQLTPLATAQYTFAKQYEYTESGGAATDLNISRTNSNVVQLGLGAKAATPLWVNPSIIIPEIHALAFYNPIVGQQNSVFSFVDGGGQMMSLFDLSRTGLIYGAALTIAVVDTLEVKFNLDFNVQDRFNSYVAYMNLRYSL
jgi:uncharacterized protein with beta-barrel porin domain